MGGRFSRSKTNYNPRSAETESSRLEEDDEEGVGCAVEQWPATALSIAPCEPSAVSPPSDPTRKPIAFLCLQFILTLRATSCPGSVLATIIVPNHA